MQSLDEVRDYVIQGKAETILRDGLRRWKKFFAEQGIQLEQHIPDWDAFYEAFQRRHIIVHNGGKVNAQYLDRVNRKFVDPYVTPQGDVISPRPYLEYAIHVFLVGGLLLCEQVWRQSKPKDRSRGFFFHGILRRLLSSEEWESAALICERFIRGRDRIDTKYEAEFRLCFWLCKKRLGQIDQVRADMDKFDPSDVDPKWALAYFALCDDWDHFVEFMTNMLVSKQIAMSDLESIRFFIDKEAKSRITAVLQSIGVIHGHTEAVDNGRESKQ